MNFTSEIEELIYNEYLEIPVSDYHGKTHYFERNIREINQLPFDLSIEIRCACVIAYFELGLYYKYLNQVDDLIHLVITENIYELNGKNIFEELLFRKGASAYNVVDYYKAKYIFSELIKIDSSNALYQTAFTRCNVDKLRYEGQNFRGITICLLILAAAVIAFELFSYPTLKITQAPLLKL